MSHYRFRLMIASLIFVIFGVCSAFSSKSGEAFNIIVLISMIVFIVEWVRSFKDKNPTQVG